jgi:hypothetical protein
VNTQLIRLGVTLDEAFEYAIIRLKRSKADYDHKGVEIVLATCGPRDQVSPVPALGELFRRDTQPLVSLSVRGGVPI